MSLYARAHWARRRALCRLGRHSGPRTLEFREPSYADGYDRDAVITEECLSCGRLLDFWWEPVGG